ncbi:heterogeneous nuclear ribonucleoprotein A0 [Danio aesculapii]|uniref:heterogeneous nuclear ribonucleoprotein A0 n=1 Tax=Danio aesculapii TaxID=1142201 RepID=UPI0024C01AE0|nr:heterogeneous nuclear ribonucleoprotein A0 [Danio aesculapii]
MFHFSSGASLIPVSSDHGIFVTNLNPHLTDSELRCYFQKFGTVTECVMRTDSSSGWPKGLGFVRYSSSGEATAAHDAGPHCVGGFQILLRKVITPKMMYGSQLNPLQHQSLQSDVCVN